MGSSSCTRMIVLWLATSFVFFLASTSRGNDWFLEFVDATTHDFVSSSSIRHYRPGSRSRSGLRNCNRQRYRRDLIQAELEAEFIQWCRPLFPWSFRQYLTTVEKKKDLLVIAHSMAPQNGHTDPTIPLKTTTSSIIKYRGGSNKSEDSNNSNSAADEKSKLKNSNGRKLKMNGKEKRKGSRSIREQNKYKDDAVRATDKDGRVLDSDSLQTEEDQTTSTTSDSAAKNDAPSKLFLVDPFRMNEIARYEASIAEESIPGKSVSKHENEDKTTTATSISGSRSEHNDADVEMKHRKGMKRNISKIPVIESNGASSIDKGGGEALRDGAISVGPGKYKNQDQQSKRKRGAGGVEKKRGAEVALTGDKENTVVNSNENTAIVDDFDGEGKRDTSDQSNSFWWIDVWTQQLPGPEDFETEDTTGDDSDNSDVPSSNYVDGKGKKAIETTKGEKLKKRKEDDSEKQNPSLIVKSIKPSSNSDANVTTLTIPESLVAESEKITSLNQFEIQTATAVIDQNVTASISKTSDVPSPYVSSGAWVLIDNLVTIGLASRFSFFRLSSKLRSIRKLSARITTLHGLLSGKPKALSRPQLSLEFLNVTTTTPTVSTKNSSTLDDESQQEFQRRIAAIDRARERVERAQAEEKSQRQKRSFFGFRTRDDNGLTSGSNKTELFDDVIDGGSDEAREPNITHKSSKEVEEEFQRMERVREIDRLISEGQKRLADLICEKDVLQRRPNPLFNYTTTEIVVTTEEATKTNLKNDVNKKKKIKTKEVSLSQNEIKETKKVEIQATREMNFPPDDLVAEYLDMMLSTRRLTKMNHSDLWEESENGEDEDDDEEAIGDDLFTASADAHRLYQGSPSVKNGSDRKKSGGGGSWLLRQSIGSRRSLGEKIGQAIETAAYKAVTAALMSFLARTISSLHGINVLKHSDIRLTMEQSPDLPPVPKDGIIRGDHRNYAEETIKTVMRRKSRRSKKRSSKHRLSEVSFVQQEAVTETLLSHVQISAPLLKLFPLAWQRALLGNIISLSCALISDFLDGLHFQILGHQLSFAFRPITEIDMARHFQMAGGPFNQRRYKAAEFEAAVQATAEDLKEELRFLDSWHERALGSGVLRTQIANMIARIVLTLTDEVLSGARMDLWSTQAGGPRMLAGLEHRIEDDEEA